MDIVYDGAHSITFFVYREVSNSVSLASRTYNTWTSWHLVPASAPYIKPYEAKLSMATLPHTSKVIDLSEALTGKVEGGRRSGEWEFIMDTEHAQMDPWHLYYKIRDAIHGKWVACMLDDMPARYDNHVYTGRIAISDFEIGEQYATIKLSYNLGTSGNTKVSRGG